MVIPILLLLAQSAQAYYGRHSTEAELEFHAVADVPYRAEVTVAELNSRGEPRRRALNLVSTQVQHLMGVFQSVSFRKTFGFPGALGERYRIRFTGVEKGRGPGRKRLSYAFRGITVFHKDAFQNADTRRVPVTMPLSPDRVYELGMSHGKNRCTDPDFNEESDFWYFWDPDRPGCPLRDDSTELVRVEGRLTRLPSTRVSYPEYDRLYGQRGKPLDVAVFLGFIRDQDIQSSRPNRRDEAFAALAFIERAMEQRGFELAAREDRFRVTRSGGRTDGINFLRRYEKSMPRSGGDLKVRVQVLLAATDPVTDDITFHRFVVPALEKADLVVYDGHSNINGDFERSGLPFARLDPDRYQIFFFNGCSGYPYFNGAFFRAKGGSRNLEVLTAGLPTFSVSSGPNVMTFLDPFLAGRTPSYQKILSDLEKSNQRNGTYLVGVKGDEDNAWRPAR